MTKDKKLACWSSAAMLPLFAQYKTIRDVEEDTIRQVLDVTPA